MVNSEASAFLAFIEPHAATIERIVRAWSKDAADLKDLKQEVLLQLWRSHHRFRHDASPRTWVYRVAMNVAISGQRGWVRRRTLRSHVEGESTLSVPDGNEDPRWMELLTLLRALPDPDP